MEAKLVESPTPTFHKSPTKARSLQNEMIGRYIVGAELGRGAFGAVFRGLDSLTGKTVAIKQIKLEKGQKPTEIQREIELLCQYEHDNIIKYYESVVIKTKLNIMLEYMENGSLSDIVEQFGVFPEALTATYIYQVLLGLQFLHSKNVIHKDIKSANILLAKDGTIKLADFGIALEITDQNTPLKGIQGSPFWMAPEVIKNEGFPTTKSDIWSIGCTVIELLTGSPPFGEESSVSVVWKIVEGEIESQFPIICSKELHDFLTKCFQRNVEERPSAEDLLKHEWIVNNIKGTIRPSLAEVRKTVQLHTRKSMLVNANNLNKYMQNKEAASLRPSDVLSLVNEKTPLVTSSPAASPAPSRMFESKGKQETETVAPIPFNLMTPPASPATSVKKETLPAGREVIQIPTGLPIRGLTAQITHSNTRKDGPKAWTEYFVVLQLGPLIWKVDKRYSNFVELHDRVSDQIKKYHSDVKLPVLPPKRRFGKMDEKFVSERREQLQKYFQDLIKIDIVLECRELKCFLIE